MRMGLVFSGILHVAVIGFGVFTIAGSKLDHQALDIEPIAIELAPVADEMALVEGDRQATNDEPPAPKPTQKPEIDNQAQHVGEGKVDSAAPLRPQERVREVEATPPPSAPPPQQAESRNMTPALPQQAAVVPEDSEPIETMPDQPVETVAVIAPLPQNAPQPRQKPTQEPTPAPPQQQVEAAADVNMDKISELIDRTPTQGGGMRRVSEPAGAGATRNIGDNRQLAQTIQNLIGGCLEKRASLPSMSGSQSRDLVVKVHMRLNRDGSIDGVPELTPSGGEAAEREIAVTQGYAALARCAPFLGLPPERYDDGWFDVTLNWRPIKSANF